MNAASDGEVSGLAEAIAAMDHAYGANDVAGYFRWFSPDARIVIPERGPVPLRAYVDRWTSVVGDGGGVERCRIEGLSLSHSPGGDAAVALYVLDVEYRGMGVAGTDHRRLAMTETWFATDGNWRLAAMTWTTLAT